MALRRRAWGAAAALALLAGCRSGPWRPEDQWSFAVTAEALEDLDENGWAPVMEAPIGGDEFAGYLALFIVLAPIALDLAMLPVTAPHDLWVAR